MIEDPWQRLKELYARIKDASVADRPRLLDELCGTDTEIRREIESMIGTESADSGFLEPVAALADERMDQAAVSEPKIPKVLGDYAIERRIGEGGMGYVYLATQQALNRKVALKLLPARPGLSMHDIERFKREAQAAAKLQHPRIVKIHDVDTIDGIHLIAMAFIEGHDLGTEIMLSTREKNGAELPEPKLLPDYRSQHYVPTVVRIVAEIAEALEHAHGQGITHRDIKPQNILIDANIDPFLVDFGLAKDHQLETITLSGDILGSPAYMSPEQALGRDATVDFRSDIYSLGVVLYELLTLERPFKGRTSREVLNNVIDFDPVRVRKHNTRIPEDLDLICHTAMARAPGDRYASARALATDCRHFLAHEAIEAKPPSLRRRAGMWAFRRQRELIIASITLAIAVLAIVAGKRVFDRRSIEGSLNRVQELVARGQFAPDKQDSDFNELERLATELGRERSKLSNAEVALMNSLATALAGACEYAAAAGLVDFRTAVTGENLNGQIEAIAAFVQYRERESRINSEIRREPTEDILDALMPLLTVSAEDADHHPIDATMSLRRADDHDGEFGTELPPVAIPFTGKMPPGFYRITVRFKNGGFREFSRWLQPLQSLALIARRSVDESRITADMIPFAASQARCIGKFPCPLSSEPHPVEAFYLDRTEVSNENYLAFCEATKSPKPRYFAKTTDFRRIANLPVVFIPYERMVEYANWRGKRLPSHLELARASFGRADAKRTYPWGHAALSSGVTNFATCPNWNIPGTQEVFELESCLWPVDSGEESKTPEGVYYLIGNVTEATETPCWRYEALSSNFDDLRPMISSAFCITFGGDFSSLSIPDSTIGSTSGCGHGFTAIVDSVSEKGSLGFRCAKSDLK